MQVLVNNKTASASEIVSSLFDQICVFIWLLAWGANQASCFRLPLHFMITVELCLWEKGLLARLASLLCQ
jgi:hypothetical protein